MGVAQDISSAAIRAANQGANIALNATQVSFRGLLFIFCFLLLCILRRSSHVNIFTHSLSQVRLSYL